MNGVGSEEYKALVARLDDALSKAEKGELAISRMLDPKERRWAEDHLKRRGAQYAFFGGYGEAERQKAYVFPDYIEIGDGSDIEHLLEEYGYSCGISALTVKGSGYEKIGHRDVLGAVLGLGIKRSVLGDLCPLDNGDFIVFADSDVGAFVADNLTKIGRDTVRVTVADTRGVSIPPRKTQEIKDTVASPRLDAVVAALCNLSRDRARAAVEAGLVDVDFEKEERPDFTVHNGAVLSVRGQGRFTVSSVDGLTRKGRYRLEAKKYI